MFGVIVAMGGVGALGGALISRPLVRALGLGKMLLATSILSVGCALLIPLAGGPLAAGSSVVMIAFLAAHQLLSDGFACAYIVQAVTLRQTVLPKHVQGRANAAIQAFASGLLPAGALVAGVLAELLGTEIAVWVGVLIGLLAPLFLLPLRHLREMPFGPEAGS
jgi:MFS family permease